jgi:oligoribonuclease NrnB/cAMP/cGMP phosphodiesterase (DHH superfamily)
MESSKKKLCLWHKGCLDGLFSAAVIGLKFGIENVEFVACEYHDPIPDLTDREVYIVDFSYRPEVLIPAIKTAKSVIMLDHHDGAMMKWKLDWENNPEWAELKNFIPIFDTSKAGCVLVWDFLFGSETCDPKPVPLILQRVQDYDLWQHNWPDSHEVQTGMVAELLGERTLSEENLYRLRYLLIIDDGNIIDDIEQFSSIGEVILKSQEQLAKAIIARNSSVITFAGHDVLICNCPYELRNIVGEMLYTDRAFSISYEDRLAEGVRKFSLRSDREKGINVLDIAQKFNGSGHPNAAGFTVDLSNTWISEFGTNGKKYVAHDK